MITTIFIIYLTGLITGSALASKPDDDTIGFRIFLVIVCALMGYGFYSFVEVIKWLLLN